MVGRLLKARKNLCLDQRHRQVQEDKAYPAITSHQARRIMERRRRQRQTLRTLETNPCLQTTLDQAFPRIIIQDNHPLKTRIILASLAHKQDQDHSFQLE